MPHEVVAEMESLKDDGESSAGFIVTSMRGEIKRRQRKRPRKPTRSDTQYLGNGRNYGISPGMLYCSRPCTLLQISPDLGKWGMRQWRSS
ncbi:hypothetical protein EIN43_13000 [Enterobacter hormaechei]|uniref:Uncharacterized protein n=1 Tax=Enterobacter hormaechei TaxID=158836 RepID=A0A4Y5ZVN1_9ENTR|nr:hypothetical protein EIN43_13000 [Enterobacter hormaechei]